MSWSLLFIYAHVVGAIVLVGYALFWVVMATAVTRGAPAEEAADLMATTRSAAWPSAGGALTLVRIGWLILIGVALTGLLSLPVGFSWTQLGDGRFGTLLLLKLVLAAAMVACLHRVLRPVPWLSYLTLSLLLGIVVVSVLLVR